MIFLIVNADDLGINSERDRGIINACEQGIVTSASIIANGRSFLPASRQAQDLGLATGVHLNLSEGQTLTGAIRGLTDAQSRLPGKQAMRRYLLGQEIDREAVHREFCAQVERVLHSGLHPDHLDGHQHCHAYPALFDLVIDVARRYDLDALRLPAPAEPADATVPADLHEDLALFDINGEKARTAFRASGLRTPQGLWGMPDLHGLDTSRLCALLESLPPGHWELMTHPGYPVEKGRPFENPQRRVELDALCSARARGIIARRKIRLATFGELPCGS